MKRAIVTSFSAASFVLSLAICAVWVRSYWVVDLLEFLQQHADGHITRVWLFDYKGRFSLSVQHPSGRQGDGIKGQFLHPKRTISHSRTPAAKVVDSEAPALRRRFFKTWTGGHGFSYWTSGRYRIAAWGGSMPCWLFVALFAVWPFVRTTSWIRKRRTTRKGCCAVCGYNLRATPDRCPECGVGAGA